MPWRKRWLDRATFAAQTGAQEGPEALDAEFEKALEKRAYEVWVSEVSKYRPYDA